MNTTFTPPFSLDELLKEVQEQVQSVRDGETWAIYARVSQFDPRNPGYSMDTQPEYIEEYARTHGAKEVLKFSDPDRTGKNSKRKGLQDMIKAIKAGRADVVAIYRLDRLYRNLESQLKFIHLLKRNRVRLVSVTEQIDTETWWGRLVLVVLGQMAEAYLHQTSTNTRTGLNERRKRGLHLGRLPLGYCNGLCSTCTDPNGEGYCPLFSGPDRPESQRGRLAVPHPIDQRVIPLIFDLYLQGLSFREIATHLNSHTFQLLDGTQAHFRPRKVEETHHEGA